jgi:type IV pilus assembly protein PilB
VATQKEKDNRQEIEAAKARAKALKVPFIDLTGKQIPVEALKEIPEEAATFYKFIPIAKGENTLEVGMVNPDDLKAREALRFIALRSQLEPRVFIITPTDFQNVLKQYRTLRGEVEKALKELEKELKEERVKVPIKAKPEEMAERIVAEAPVTKIVAVILRHASEGRASDIHIEPIEDRVKVRFRVDGVLYTSLFVPKEVHSAIVSRIKILANLKIDETRVPQDGRFHTVIDKKKIDFRVSTLPTANGEKVALRLLDPSVGLRSFAELGLQGYNLKMLEQGLKKPFGMILLTGPTGSGKTTTLYAILNTLNKEGVNIISLEDPVEYYIEGVNQSQIRPEIGYDFASGLRHILRQDPDIIMVGEIRDEETAGLTIHAALTGHTVLSTIHTNNVVGVIPRLIDMGIDNFLLPPTLNLAIAQRLLKRLCPQCKKEITAPPQITEIIEEELAKLSPSQRKKLPWKKPYKIYQARGCKFCANKGTKGRIALFEILSMTPEMEEIIIKEPTEAAIEEEARRQGMITMKQDGVIKVLQGIISFEEMLKVVEE